MTPHRPSQTNPPLCDVELIDTQASLFAQVSRCLIRGKDEVFRELTIRRGGVVCVEIEVKPHRVNVMRDHRVLLDDEEVVVTEDGLRPSRHWTRLVLIAGSVTFTKERPV